ncbi:hypothetical protein MKW94_002002 [Papaver nudicaule]|uniref:Phloem protein 2 n=1 Tax=Papaver nudicaule TaxID=74823 RepID=A0AA41V094_PAPNU|nr:hypothetical protein [Papaver nudicaule]
MAIRTAHQRGRPQLAANYREETNSTTGAKTLILYPDALNVIWGGASSNNRYWKRTAIPGSQIAALELVGVYWLEVSGRLELSSFFTAGKKYKLYFVIQMKQQNSSGWDNYDIWFNIRIAGQKSQRQSMKFNTLAPNVWHNVPGNGLEFTVPQETSSAALTFAMYDIECEDLKKGLLIREVRIEEV